MTIPAGFREQFRFLPDTEVESVVQDDGVRLRRVDRLGGTRGDRVVERLRGRARSRMTTDEILALTRLP